MYNIQPALRCDAPVAGRHAIRLWLSWLAVCLFLAGQPGLAGAADAPTQAAAPADDAKAQTVVHMLDYVGADYPQFVRDGKVLNADEFAEQREFGTQAVALLGQLPPTPEQPALLAQARLLQTRIEAKAPGPEVSALASQLRGGVIQAWQLRVAPRQAPVPGRGAQLYVQNCVACHGAQGLRRRPDGPRPASHAAKFPRRRAHAPGQRLRHVQHPDPGRQRHLHAGLH